MPEGGLVSKLLQVLQMGDMSKTHWATTITDDKRSLGFLISAVFSKTHMVILNSSVPYTIFKKKIGMPNVRAYLTRVLHPQSNF